MATGFTIYRKLETGEILQVAWRPDLNSAERLVSDLTQQFPAEYGIEPATSRPARCFPPSTRWQH